MRVPKIPIRWMGALLILCFSVPTVAAPKAELWPVWQAHDEANTATIDHSPWQSLLDRYLVGNSQISSISVRCGHFGGQNTTGGLPAQDATA